MYIYAESSKDKYPYRTLHLSDCGTIARSYRTHTLSAEEVARMDSIRVDICGRCMPVKRNADGSHDYHPAHLHLWSIQRAFKDAEAESWKKVHAVRRLVALEIAMEEAKANLDLTDKQTADLYAEYGKTGRDGSYMLPEVNVR